MRAAVRTLRRLRVISDKGHRERARARKRERVGKEERKRKRMGEEKRERKMEKERRSLRLTSRGGITTALAVKCFVKERDEFEFCSVCRDGKRNYSRFCYGCD